MKINKTIFCMFFAVLLGIMPAFVSCGKGKSPSTGSNSQTQNDSESDSFSDGGSESDSFDKPDEREFSYYVRCDKDTYYEGEKIYLTFGGDEECRVEVYASGNSPLYSYKNNGLRRVIGDENSLKIGEYSLVLKDGKGEEKSRTEISVVDYSLIINKDTYYVGEDIIVTAVGTGNAWVGLYKKNEKPGDVTSICWYYIDKNTKLSGQSYIIQRSGTYIRSEYKTLPAGEYKMVLFSEDAQTSIVKQKEFIVVDGNTPLATIPTNVCYKIDRIDSGIASGEMIIEFDKDSNYSSEIVAYWANEDGPLGDYLAFSPQKVYSHSIRYNCLENVMIPSSATHIYFYGKNVNGLSQNYYSFALPEGCQFVNKGKTNEFNVVSDIHISMSTSHSGKEIYNEHFMLACEDISSLNDSSNGLFIVGDVANSGLSSEWAKAQEIMNSSANVPTAYYALGNHDLYEEKTPYDEKIKDFLKYSGKDKAYYEVVVEGIHHIVLGSQEQQTDKNSKVGAMGVDAIMHDDQLEWLDSRLKDIYSNDGERVFVYCHQSMYDTIAGSLKGHNWDGVRPDEKLKAILKKYPKVILFNGHSHWVMQSYRNAYFASDALPNIFNTSSAAYLWSTTDKEVSVMGSQGYYVRVYKDKVAVLGRDFVSRNWIPEACYIVG